MARPGVRRHRPLWNGSTPRQSDSTSSGSRPSTCASSCDSSTTSRRRWCPSCGPRSIVARPANGVSRCWRWRCIGREGSPRRSTPSLRVRVTLRERLGLAVSTPLAESRCASCARTRTCTCTANRQDDRSVGRAGLEVASGLGADPRRRVRGGALDRRRCDRGGTGGRRPAHVGARSADAGAGVGAVRWRATRTP